MKKIILLILFLGGLIFIVASCSYFSEKASVTEDKNKEVYLNINKKNFYTIKPFYSSEGFICVVPYIWKDSIEIIQKEKTQCNDSIIFRYTFLNSVFINTVSGNMNNVDSSKDHTFKEPGTIKIVSANGVIQYDDSLKYIKGRGNSSWTKEKKSYNIALDRRTKMLGLKKSEKYNLISTHGLTNEFALQIARDFGCSSAISSELVNLYLNGDYHGLYILSNKVDIDKSSVNVTNLEKKNKKYDKRNHLTIESEDDSYKYIKGIESPEDITGGYLIEVMNFVYKYQNLPCGFISKNGNYFRFKSPENASKEEVLYIKQAYQEFYDAIKSPDGINPITKKYYTDLIHLDSFVKYYLIEESLSNMDGGYGNLYFYKDINAIDNKFYVGPVWDMEWSMGINSYPYFLYPQALNVLPGSNNESQKMFYYLYQHKDFREKVDSLFQNVLYPIIDQRFCADTIPFDLENDGTLNYLRWPDRYSSSIEEYRKLCSYMRPHIDFLKEIFSSDTKRKDYCKIIINAGFSERNIMFFVKKGEVFSFPDIPWFSVANQKKEKDGWYENNIKLDNTDQVIQEDKFYELHWK